ncbi:MAG: glycosyltransferase [Acidocella sp.]|nr:glycosyltransferase [Acidocella sp.]
MSLMPFPGPVAYIMKRYPRLSETFILNEIRAMERLGTDLHIFSLLPPEPPPHHPLVAEVEAPLHVLPPPMGAKIARLARAHMATALAAPGRYAGTLMQASLWSVTSRSPLAVWKHFIRAGFVADECRRHEMVHIHAHFANTPTSVAHFASLMTGLPFSFTAHAKDLYLTPRRIIARRVRAARFVATCTRYNAKYLEDISPGAAIRLIYHGIDLDTFGAAAPQPAGQDRKLPLILSVGRLVPKKGFVDLIAACAILRSAHIPFRLRIVGAGPLKATLDAQIESLGLRDTVTLAGSMTQAGLVSLYRQADLFALAPRIEENGDRDGIPNVIAEAMACSVPVIATDVSGIPEMVRHEETGLLVPPRDAVALAGAIQRLLQDRELSARLTANGRALLEREFDLWTTTRALHRLIGCQDCEVPGGLVCPDEDKALPHAVAP